ncbi:MAG: methionine biosynthesis protein MetW [bacterium]
MYRDIYLKNTYEEIVKLIDADTRVLDLGCGDGEMLFMLYERKNVYGLGLDIDTTEVLKCIKRGVSVVQEDINNGLKKYKDNSFDYVVMSETLQAVKDPDKILKKILKVGKKAIVAFPNFAHYKTRLSILFNGKMPKSNILPFEWYDTPNIHHLTIRDFKDFCKNSGIKILSEVYLGDNGKRIGNTFTNFFAEEAIFLLQKGEDEKKVQIKEISLPFPFKK